MSVLSTAAIETRLGRTDESRLIIAPILEREQQLKSGQAAIDVRLGSRFRLAQPTLEAVIDTVNDPVRISEPRFVFVPFGESIVLHPHQLLLGETLEVVSFPNDLMAYVVGRSAWARDGLVVATAVGVHPGFSGPITLELRNLGEVPLRLFPGDPIAQLFIHEVQEPAPKGTTAESSQFAGASGPRTGRHRSELLEQKLKSLSEARGRSAALRKSSSGENPAKDSSNREPQRGL